jgi:tetratricopeptide (TPR) repeat protein
VPARLFYAESLRICREMGDVRLGAMASRGLGLVAFDEADFPESSRHFEEVLTSGRALESADLILYAFLGLGEVARAEGNLAAARRLHEEALPLAREEGDSKSLGAILGNLGMMACDEGDLPAARAYFREGLSIDLDLGYRSGVASAISGLAAVAARQGAWVRAARLAGVAETLYGESEFQIEHSERDFRDRYVAVMRDGMGDSAFEDAKSEGRSIPFERALREALNESED